MKIKHAIIVKVILLVVSILFTFSGCGTEKNENKKSLLLLLANSDLVSVPGGIFIQSDGTESFAHYISEFKLGKYEVTYGLWYNVHYWAINHGYTFENPGREGDDGVIGALPTAADREPVTYINWRDAMVWCNAYSEKSNLEAMYRTSGDVIIRDSSDANAAVCDAAVCMWDANGYRLPSEGEWQYAASYINGSSWLPWDHVSGDSTGYCYPEDAWTSTDIGLYAWYDMNSGDVSHAVGTKKPNYLGIYDMGGNVFEWCWDFDEAYPASAAMDYRGPAAGTSRSERGGSFNYGADSLLIGYRRAGTPSIVSDRIGFRVAKSAQ